MLCECLVGVPAQENINLCFDAGALREVAKKNASLELAQNWRCFERNRIGNDLRDQEVEVSRSTRVPSSTALSIALTAGSRRQYTNYTVTSSARPPASSAWSGR